MENEPTPLKFEPTPLKFEPTPLKFEPPAQLVAWMQGSRGPDDSQGAWNPPAWWPKWKRAAALDASRVLPRYLLQKK